MRRLTAMLAAGLLAAGTVLTAGGAASAAPAAARQPTCPGGTALGVAHIWVQPGSVQYFLGTPNNLSSGAAAFLKPSANGTVETPGNGGTGFASQQWQLIAAVGVLVATNVKTGLSLRVRNSGPV